MINVVITTPVGVETCQLDNGLLINTSVPGSVARQIEDAFCFNHQFKGVATYESEDSEGRPYKYNFPWELRR